MGLVVPGVVAALGDSVAHIVLNAALVPPEGGCGADCLKPAQREGLVSAMEQARRDNTAITLPGPPPDPEAFRGVYGGDPLDDALDFVVPLGPRLAVEPNDEAVHCLREQTRRWYDLIITGQDPRTLCTSEGLQTHLAVRRS